MLSETGSRLLSRPGGHLPLPTPGKELVKWELQPRSERMHPTDEELLHAFYAGDVAALETLTERYTPLLGRIASQILETRTGSVIQALREWDIDERVTNVWLHVLMTRHVVIGVWPHQRLSALTWIIHLLCLEMDRHLDLRGPF